ncbi:chorismate mutase [Proteiniclasticum sp. C24MP]|uniref:chorismate mutase n=1 Tax=Proteiniclasticum sp. C24MP TaxID=3374101 RepID=UPI00375450D4
MIAIRGAITIEQDTPEQIKDATLELLIEIMNRNHLDSDKMVSVLFTATTDIKSAYPGKFMREGLNIYDTAILHFQEMNVEGSLPLCIRVLIHYNDDIEAYPIYLRGAKVLRPDLHELL